MSPSHPFPFDPRRRIGTLVEIGPSYARANFPRATEWARKWLHGAHLGPGVVGEYVVIETPQAAVFGRISKVELPERERLSVEIRLGHQIAPNPLGTVQLLATISLVDGAVNPGVREHPRLGARVFASQPPFTKWVVEATQVSDVRRDLLMLETAFLPDTTRTPIRLTPERLFGRHCAILGSTGAGKSWTMARLLEQCCRDRAKVILLDATGEFHRLNRRIVHTFIGEMPDKPPDSAELVFPYRELQESDLFALFSPAGQVQAPKLRQAVKSLKLAAELGNAHDLVDNGLLPKTFVLKESIEEAKRKHGGALIDPSADFDVSLLPAQIEHECVWPSADYGKDPTRWGDSNAQDLSHCTSLITRVEGLISDQRGECMFQPGGKETVSDRIDTFLADADINALRISLRHLPEARGIRAIVVNAIGRRVFKQALCGSFRDQPVVVFLDEAHRFIPRESSAEDVVELDSFEIIAKEGRKYGATLCLASQRPRDLSEGVLAQMGALIVHRLINDSDLKVVERACSEIDRSAASFLPSLAPGQAVFVGVDFPLPVIVQLQPPDRTPESRGPDYQEHWSGGST